MPTCVECGAEAPREDMFGPNDELRCSRCAKGRRERFVPHTHYFLRTTAPVTIAALAFATLATVLRLSGNSMGGLFDGDPIPLWKGEVWRLPLFVLVQTTPIALLINLGFGYYLGRYVESGLGSLRYAGFLLLLAAGSSAAAFCCKGPSFGFSGVVFGMLGFLWMLRRSKAFAHEALQIQVGQLFLIIIVVSLLGEMMDVATLVSRLTGALLGASLGWMARQKHNVTAVAGLVVAVIGLVAVAPVAPSPGRIAYQRSIELEREGDLVAAQANRRKAILLTQSMFAPVPFADDSLDALDPLPPSPGE